MQCTCKNTNLSSSKVISILKKNEQTHREHHFNYQDDKYQINN